MRIKFYRCRHARILRNLRERLEWGEKIIHRQTRQVFNEFVSHVVIIHMEGNNNLLYDFKQSYQLIQFEQDIVWLIHSA